MGVIQGGSVIPGVLVDPILGSGAPSIGTDEIQTLTIGGAPSGGTFKIAFEGFTTGPITWSATNNTLRDNVDAALELLPNIGTGGVVTAVGSMTAGVGTLTLTMGGNLTKKNVGLMTIADNSMTGTAPTVAIATTTPGVDATLRDCLTGQRYIDSATGIEYINTSTTPLAPTWSTVGTANGINTADINDLQVTTNKLAANAVTAAKVTDGTLTRTQQSAAAGRKSLSKGLGTIATTSNTDVYVIAPETGALDSVDFSGIDALAANDTNFITFSITNLGQAGAGSTAMLAATDVNTTKVTGGSALAANTKRSLTVHGTGANLVVTAGDRLRIRAAATGTLANTVTGSEVTVRFSGTT